MRPSQTTARWVLRWVTVLISVLVFGVIAAQAGPLSDRLSERRAAGDRQQAFVDAPALGSDIRVLKDVPYGDHERQRFDVYRTIASKDAPVIFMVHGGGWRRGDKALKRVIENKVNRWVSRGFVFISTNYRLLPDADPVQQAADVARAVAAVQKRAREFGGDPDRFILMGHSAGAHFVALLSADPSMATPFGTQPWLGTVILDSAALDTVDAMRNPPRPLKHLYKQAFGDEQRFWREASPYHRLSKMGAPMLAVCSSTRNDDPCAVARKFCARAETLGRRCAVLPRAMSHREINEELGKDTTYTRDVERFIASLDRDVAGLLRP